MTKVFAFTVAALGTLLGGMALSADVVVPQDTTPFKVTDGDIVRIPVKGIAGTQVTAKVTGEAKHVVNSVTARTKGKLPIGPGNHEVEVKPTAKGKVTVEVTITPPNGTATTEKYEFDVE